MCKLLISSAIVAMAATSVSAATLDFAAAGAASERSVEGQTIDFDGIDVTFDAAGDYFAYLDGLDGGRPAGLGVCQALAGDQCARLDDDNITFGESVTILFNRTVDLTNLIFRGEHHFLLDEAAGELDSTDTLFINGTSYTFAAAQAATFLGVDSMTFAFGGGARREQFYVSSATVNVVPLPGGLPLMATAFGLLGAGAVARRRKQA